MKNTTLAFVELLGVTWVSCILRHPVEKLIYISSVWKQNVVWKIFWQQWMIGTERDKEKFVQEARLDDNHDIRSSIPYPYKYCLVGWDCRIR